MSTTTEKTKLLLKGCNCDNCQFYQEWYDNKRDDYFCANKKRRPKMNVCMDYIKCPNMNSFLDYVKKTFPSSIAGDLLKTYPIGNKTLGSIMQLVETIVNIEASQNGSKSNKKSSKK